MSARPEEIIVGMGEQAVARGDAVLIAHGLGSCVALVLHDPTLALGGLAHVVLPSASLARGRSRPARTAETAVPALVQALSAVGAGVDRLGAKLIGGASMFAALQPSGAVAIGERNILACRAALRAARIPVLAEAVGGTVGRSVWFDVRRGVAVVRSVGQPEHVL